MQGRGIDDSAFEQMSWMLDYLSRYQRVIADNVSNIDTPGYRAQTLDFETALMLAAEEPDRLQLLATHERHISHEPPAEVENPSLSERRGLVGRVDGNTVDINVEMVELLETSLKYRTVAELASKRLGLYRMIAAER